MYNLYSCTTISLIVIPSEDVEVVLLFTVCNDGWIMYQIINQLSSPYAIVCTFHSSFWICNCYSCVTVSFLAILRGSIWYTVRPIYFQPFWINYGVTWLQKKISSININSRGYFLSNKICMCRESPSSSPGSILFEKFWLATIANQIQNWLAISDIV